MHEPYFAHITYFLNSTLYTLSRSKKPVALSPPRSQPQNFTEYFNLLSWIPYQKWSMPGSKFCVVVLWVGFSVRHMLLLATSLCFLGLLLATPFVMVRKVYYSVVYSCRQAKLKQGRHNMYKASFPCRSS